MEAEESDSVTELNRNLNELEGLVEELNLESTAAETMADQASLIEEIISSLTSLESLIDDALSLRSSVVTRPFEGRLITLSGLTLGPIDYFVPGTVALLLQHG